MHDTFLDSSTLHGQGRIREYVHGWLDRLDYRDRLDRSWSADELGARIWERVAGEFGPLWPGRVVTNPELARVIAAATVEDYFAVYPVRRGSRFSVAGPLADAGFRRCVLDFLHDLEEFEPTDLPADPEAAAAMFWREVLAHPRRWGYSAAQGPFVDDLPRAQEVAVEAIRDYFDLLRRAADLRAGAGSG